MTHQEESINFDGHPLHQEQEEELEFEDCHREQELRTLLLKALPDDLLEDDAHSFSTSRDTSSLSSHSPELSPQLQSLATSDQGQFHYESDAHQLVSASGVSGQSLPLQTAAEILLAHEAEQTCHLDNLSHQSQPDISCGMGNHTSSDSQDWSLEHQSNGLVIPAPSTIPFSQGLSPTSVAWMEARQQVDVQIDRSNSNCSENDDLSPERNRHEDVRNDVYMYQAPQQLHPGISLGHRFRSSDHRNGKECDHPWEQDSDENQRPSQHYEPPKPSKPKHSTIRQTQAEHWEELDGKYIGSLSHPLSNQQIMLKYHGRHHDSNNVDIMGTHQEEKQIFRCDNVQQQRQQQEMDELEQLQKQFKHAGSDGRDLIQLEILYKARGREIQDLTAQLKLLQEESARERRILNHQLAMLQDEKEGVGTSYQESQKIIDDLNIENHTLKGEVQALQHQVQSLSESKQQVLSELDTAKATIESFSHQLSEMQRSQPLHRVREQHESLLVGLEQKYSQEMANLREKLDAASNMALEKSTAVEQLEAQLATSLKVANEARLEHAEVVNRLTASLHDSQKRCQELIMHDSMSMMQELQIKLQQANTSKAMTDDLCKSLQEELSELKDQLMIYEGAADLGVFSVSGVTSSQSPKTPTDADIVRNLAKEDWKTPQASRPARDPQPMSPEETLERLKMELSRSLQSIKSKREHVTRLQTELKEAREEGNNHRWKASEAEDKLRQAEVKIETLKRSVSEPVLQACNAPARNEFEERLQAELDAKSQECKNFQQQMTVLKTAMAQMVSESDQDKKEAVERCQRTCLQLHEDMSQNLRKQLVCELQAEKENMEEAHCYQLQEVRNEKAQLEADLHKTKELYLQICEEKKSLEEDADKKMEEMCAEAVMQVRAEMQKEKQKTLDELKVSLEANHRAEVVILQEQAKKEKEEEFLQLRAKQEEAAREQGREQKTELSSWRTKYSELERSIETRIKKAIEEERVAVMGDKEEKEDKENEILMLTADLKAVQKKYAELEADVVKQVAVAVDTAKEQWMKQEKQKRMSLERVTAATIDQMKADHAVQHAEWQSRQASQEEDLTERVATAVRQAKEEWNKEEKQLRETLAKAVEENSAQEKEAQNQLDKLRRDLEKIKGSLRVAREDERHIHGKYSQLKAKHQKEVAELREELGLCQAKLREAEQTVQEELKQLQSEMHEANLATMESMQERVSTIQQKHSIRVEQMKAEWEEERRTWAKGEKPVIQRSIAVQTASDNESEVVVELRQHYLASVENVRASAMSYVTNMQKRCQETLRMAICEERQHVAAKMHKFYSRQEGKVRQRMVSSDRWHSQQSHTPSGRDEPTINKAVAMNHTPRKSAGRTDELSDMNQQLIPSRKRNAIHSDENLRARLGASLTNRPGIDPSNGGISLQPIKQRSGSGSSVSQKVSVKDGNNPARHHQHDNFSDSADRAVQLSNTLATRQKRFQAMAKQDQQNVEEKHAQSSPVQHNRINGQNGIIANVNPLHISSIANDNGQNSAVWLKDGNLSSTGTCSSSKWIHLENKAKTASSHGSRRQAQCDNESKRCSKGPTHDLSSEGKGSKLSANQEDTILQKSEHPTVCSAVHEDILLPPVNMSCESVETYSTTQPYHLDRGVDVSPPQNQPFLDGDFSQGSKLSKRVVELQSSFLNTQPVRDNVQQRAHSTMEYSSHFTQEVVRSTSLSSKTSHEDSGINSPAYIHQ